MAERAATVRRNERTARACRSDAGNCRYCANPTDGPSRRTCFYHAIAQRAREYRAKGLVAHKPVAPKFRPAVYDPWTNGLVCLT